MTAGQPNGDRTCAGCAGLRLDRVRRYRNNTRYGRAVFGEDSWLYECRGCGLIQLIPLPQPSRLDQYYAEDYRKVSHYGASVANAATFPRDNLFYFNRGESIAELVTPYLSTPTKRILDVGTGFGHVLHSLGQRVPGASLQAIEYSSQAVSHLKRIGVDVFQQPVEVVLAGGSGTWDLIVLSHVLEHLANPGQVVRAIHRNLSPGGLCYVEVPNITRESMHQHPDHQWAPRYDEPHLMFFSLPVLKRLMESAGFEQVFLDTAGGRYRYISALRFALPSLKPTIERLLPKAVFYALRRSAALQSARVQEREPTFTEYGGDRIWIRSLWRRA